MTAAATTKTRDPETATLLAGLVTAKPRGEGKLSAATGPRHARHRLIRTQVYFSGAEHAALKVTRDTLAQHVGRPIAQALTVRLALRHLGQAADRSLIDPTAATRLANELWTLREEVAAAPA